ncbi:MAG: ATP-binding cassette domain-containing protein [Bacillota bacterium]
MSDLAISLKGIRKRYGNREALGGIDLAVPTGSIFALLGPNGAGKTTLLRALLGMIRPDSGEGRVLGYALGPHYPPRALKERTGYVAQHPSLYEGMTARELIDFARGVHTRWDDRTVRRYLELFSIPEGVRVRQMSLGTRAQLALTLVMGGNPELLILDEPTLGLDPLHRHQYLQVLLADSLEAGRTVLLSSHDLHQIERLADRVAILREGRVVLTGAVDDLKLTEKRVRVAGAVTEAALLAVEGVRRAVREPNGWLLSATGQGDLLRERLLQLDGVTAVQVYDQSLEEIFLSHVS